ncbi:MAG: P44/Msp2 family outer membrane protein [Anaplasma sp.]
MSKSAIRCFFASVVCALIGGSEAVATSSITGLEHWRLYEGVESRRSTGIYAGGGYAPSWGGVRNLKVEVPGKIWRPVPLKRDAGSRDTRMPGSYDLVGQGESVADVIKFQRAGLAGITGSVGYALGRNIRLEFEGSRESWPVASATGRTWKGGDAVFLLAGGYGAADLSESDEEGFTREMVRLKAVTALANHYRGERDSLKQAVEYSKFVRTALQKASASERKALFEALTVQGVVIEIPRVTSTSLTANSCYDLVWGGVPVIPYGCVGMGVSFIEAAKGGGVKAEFAGRVKLGLTYEITPQISLYGGALYHRAVNYDNQKVAVIPLEEGSEGILQSGGGQARVAFNLSYFAGEVGIRITS